VTGVLSGGDAGEQPPGGVELLRQTQLPERLPDRPQLVVLVVDQEAGVDPGRRRLPAEEADAEAVEGGHPAPQGTSLEQGLRALAHLLRRLVGEGDGEDPLGGHAPLQHEVGDAMGDDAGLAAARPGQDQHRPLHRQHGLALGGVERVEDRRRDGQGEDRYSTVTDLARLRGWSTSRPARKATW